VMDRPRNGEKIFRCPHFFLWTLEQIITVLAWPVHRSAWPGPQAINHSWGRVGVQGGRGACGQPIQNWFGLPWWQGGGHARHRDTIVVVVHCTAPCSPAGDFSEIPLE
jgi:hypothetical protein